MLGLSRRTEPSIPNVEAVSVDLLDPGQVRDRLGGIRDVTHIVFGAYIEKQTAAEKSTVNVAILRNLLDVVEETSPGLRHVTFYQGGKAYGADLGPFKTPAREDDPRLMPPPNFYYDQEDLLRERQKGKDWSFTALRPEAVCGFAVGNPMNLLTVIAVYAAISKELGIPLRFPGTEAAYRALYQVSRRHPGRGRRLGRYDAGCAKRDLQHHQRRLLSLAAHVAADRAHVQHGLGRSDPDAARDLHGRQGAALG